MTIGEILEQSWKHLGEPTDLNPNTTSGRDTLLIGVNQAIKMIASYKDPATGRFFNFNKFRKELFRRYNLLTGTATSSSDSSVVYVEDLPQGETDIAGSFLEIDNELRLIIDNNTTECIVDKPFSFDPSLKSYILYPRWIFIPSNIRFMEVLKVEDVENKQKLRPAGFHEDFLNQLKEIRDPQSFYRVGNRIYFDTPPEDEKVYRIWVYRLPETYTQNSSVPELPESVHFAIVLWTVYWGYQWKQEPRDAYAAQERFKNYMRTVKNEFDVKDEMRSKFKLTAKPME